MLIKSIGAIVAMILVVVIIVAVGMWRGLIPVPGALLFVLLRGAEPEYTARYYPPDTMAYTWVTLVPAEGQVDHLQEIWERLNRSRAFRDVVDLAQDDFEEETGVDVEKDVMPWIGPEISVGLLDVDWENEEWVVAGMVGVRDREVAEDFLGDWLDYMEDDRYTEFSTDTYMGFDIAVSDDGLQAYALTEDWLVFATDERALEDVLVRIAGEEDSSLETEELFQEARSNLPGRRFASVYFSPGEAEDLLKDAYEMFGSEAAGWRDDENVEWIAASVGLVDSGILFEVAAPVGIDGPLEVDDLDDPAGVLPDDTLGFFAMTFDPDVDRWREAMKDNELGQVLAPDEFEDLSESVAAFSDGAGALSLGRLEADDGLDVVLDLGLNAVRAATGIDLEDDLFDHLGGELIVAVGDVDLTATRRSAGRGAVESVLMLSYLDGSKDELTNTLDDVVDLLVAVAGLDTETEDVGADDRAVVFDLEPVSGEATGYRPGYVLYDGYLTLGSTDGALESVVERQNGDAKALSADEGYLRAIRSLPENRQFLGYLDLHRIIRQLDGGELGLSRDVHRVLDESVGTVAMSSYSPHCVGNSKGFECQLPAGADVWRYTAVLTLFPE